MIFLSATGRKIKVNSSKYVVDWDAKSRSKLQASVKQILKEVWRGDRVFEEFPVVGTRMTIDFYNATQEVAIEVDGKQHIEFNKFFHRGNRMNFLDQLKRDDKKEIFCEDNGIKLYRIYEGEDLSESVQKILDDYEK
jgi:very-short-patch-repair endonuclease